MAQKRSCGQLHFKNVDMAILPLFIRTAQTYRVVKRLQPITFLVVLLWPHLGLKICLYVYVGWGTTSHQWTCGAHVPKQNNKKKCDCLLDESFWRRLTASHGPSQNSFQQIFSLEISKGQAIESVMWALTWGQKTRSLFLPCKLTTKPHKVSPPPSQTESVSYPMWVLCLFFSGIQYHLLLFFTYTIDPEPNTWILLNSMGFADKYA